MTTPVPYSEGAYGVKMDPSVKQLWMDELRNGNRKQAQRYLNTGEAQCCLGVLCELAIEQGLDIKAESYTPYEKADPLITYDGSAAVLPTAVMAWSGIIHDNGAYGRNNALSMDNDQGKTFAEIADIIEKEF